jgi:hypothetical protein
MQLIQIHSVLNPTKVGSNLQFDAQIRAMLVSKAMMYSHQSCRPKINPGTMITALANHDTASTML